MRSELFWCHDGFLTLIFRGFTYTDDVIVYVNIEVICRIAQKVLIL